MHDSAPIPPDPESERRGHELRDVAIRPVLYFLIGLFIFGGALQTVMGFIMAGFVAQDTQVGVPSLGMEGARKLQEKQIGYLRDYGNIGDNIHPAPSPPLQRDTTADMLRMYAEEDAQLNAYHVDKTTGRVQVPIRRALQIVAKKGLPHRDTPESLIDKDLPYPKRSDPYKAKY